MMLDCNTPLGKRYIEEQERTSSKLGALGFTVINTSGQDHRTDVILAKEIKGSLTAVYIAEIKSRQSAAGKPITIDYIKRNGYLISNSKIIYGAEMSKCFKVPFLVIVSVMNEDKLMVWRITDDNGELVETVDVRRTRTSATVNGGDAVRENAFLSGSSQYLTII